MRSITKLSLVVGAGLKSIGFALSIAGAMTAAVGAVHSAAAQVRPVEPYYAVVTKDSVPMKAGDGGTYYAVRVLKAGQTMRVDGEGPGWVRAAYMPGMRAFVKAEEVTLADQGKTAKLLRPSRLMAANVTGGERGNWWPLLGEDLPPGTNLAVAETLTSAAGGVYGYLVTAPASARGFVPADSVRHATDAEATEAKKTLQEATPPVAGTPKVTEPQAAAPKAAPKNSQPVASNPQNQPASGGVQTVPTAEPAAAVPGFVKDGRTDEPATTQPSGEPVAQPVPTPHSLPTKTAADLEALKSLFERVMTEKKSEAEVETVMAEFRRRIDTLGNSPEEQRVKEGLRQRLPALELRTQWLSQLRTMQDERLKMDVRANQVGKVVQEAERQAIYTVVGRLLPSTVYDGKRGMPLMYRVESADAVSTRTLGYVVPTEEVELMTKLGKVVGISGDTRYDEALKMNIFTPRRMDVLVTGGLDTATVPTEGATPK